MGRVLLMLVPVLVLLVSPTGDAATIRVSAGRPGTTIQDAIDAAAPGDTVAIECGTYYEYGLVMKEGVTLRSETGDTSCVTIDAQLNDTVIYCTDLTDATVIEGIKFTGGSAADGGGMCCENASPQVVRCAFVENDATGAGGGVCCCCSSQPVFTECTFRDNMAYEGGGLAGRSASCEITVVECSFLNNDTYQGGGAVFSDTVAVLFNDCRFAYNDVTTFGGGLMTSGGICDISGCTFELNTAGRGGALTVGGPAVCGVEHTLFYQNRGDFGGVLYGYSFSPTRAFTSLANCTLVGNVATFDGNALALRQNFLCDVQRCILTLGVGGTPVTCETPVQPYPNFSCTNVFGNYGGDWVGCLAGMYLMDENFSEDPLFCMEENPDLPYSLNENSPCLPEYSPCGQLVGAFEQGCGDETAIENVTWGMVKSMYR